MGDNICPLDSGSKESSRYTWIRPLGAAAGLGSALKAESVGEAGPGARVFWIKGLARAHLVSPIFLAFHHLTEVHKIASQSEDCAKNSLTKR